MRLSVCAVATSEETRAAIAADIPKWAGVIQDANIKPGN